MPKDNIDFTVLTTGQRIKHIRKQLKMTQAGFAEALGIERKRISQYETNYTDVPEYIIKGICREYNIEYNFLKFGSGNIYKKNTQPILEIIKEEYNLNDIELMIVKNYLMMEPEMKKSLLDGLMMIVNGIGENGDYNGK